MLRDLQNYIAEQTQISAQDMNTLAQAVKILNNLSGPNMFRDGTGIAFRRQVVPDVEDDLGELDGMIPQMTSQLTKGWGDLRLVNRA